MILALRENDLGSFTQKRHENKSREINKSMKFHGIKVLKNCEKKIWKIIAQQQSTDFSQGELKNISQNSRRVLMTYPLFNTVACFRSVFSFKIALKVFFSLEIF